MTTPSLTTSPVRRTITVAVPQAHAFRVFTGEMGRWWPPSHHIGSQDLAAVVIEPHLGGRWFERGKDGAECEWGRVLVWDPPHRVTLAWHLGDDWTYHPEPDQSSEVQVRFTADGPSRTIIHLEHRGFERHAGGGTDARTHVDSPDGWTLCLAQYVEIGLGGTAKDQKE